MASFPAAKAHGSDELPVYRLSNQQLEMGAAFGNARCWIDTRGSGEIEHLFSCDLGEVVFGAIAVRYAGFSSRMVNLKRGAASAEHRQGQRKSFIRLRPEGQGMVEIHPCYQRHEFELPGSLAVRETVFVPCGEDPAAYQIVEIVNQGDTRQQLRVYGFARLRGLTEPNIQARFDPMPGALLACNQSHPEWVRSFGCLGAKAARWETSLDFSQVYEPTSMLPLSCDTSAVGDIMASLEVVVELKPGAMRRFAFLSSFSHQGEDAAKASFAASTDFEERLKVTVDATRRALTRSQVMTPDPVLNEGAAWAKVNMLKVMCSFPQGRAFTNDPSQSSAVVARDSFWFVYGCDHLDCEFSRSLLDIFTQRQQSCGKIIEFYDAVTGEEHDYGLNINDNTPLFVLAVNHHWRSTGDVKWLTSVYPAVARSVRYIMTQRDERGLVVCTSTGTGVHGIASWRNIIDDYTLSGAVTEINAECCAALRAAGHLAENLGFQDDAHEFSEQSKALQEAINRHLLNPDNDLYYLNVDLDGRSHTDVTGDQVFPVLFRVSPKDVGYRIISRLNSPDLWTEAGLRTASRDALEYQPYGKSGLVGGVWPGLTWWYAFAAARYHPEFMVKALRSSFQHYNRNPRQNNTVPGQFSEWFDGESLVNRGMRLSPWEAPRFLWAAVEGVCGVVLSPGELKVQPLIPDAWQWIALRNLPFKGKLVSFFGGRHKAGKMHLYSTHSVDTAHALEVYPDDVTDQVMVPHPNIHHLAMKREGGLVVCIGNSSEQTSVAPVRFDGLLDASTRYRVEEYNSEFTEWSRGETGLGADLGALAVSVNGQGYRILRFTQR